MPVVSKPSKILFRPDIIDHVEIIHAVLLWLGTHSGARQEITSRPDDLSRYGFGDKAALSTLIADVDGEFAGPCLHFPIFSTRMRRLFVQDRYVESRSRGWRAPAASRRARMAVYRRHHNDPQGRL
ncbi:hypothetical protein [Mesorhizobium sp. 43Arga]